ncbi:MAG: tetratricopeptide repeat protein [Acidobacteriia bacterium]|nr:tetratricopeptide repeat protein [Terriglobia bacterium]
MLVWARAGALVVLCLLCLSACNRDPIARRDTFFRKGQEYARTRKFAQAAIEFQNAVRMDPKFAEGYHQLGLVNTELGRLPEAARAFSRALELNPEHAGSALGLGEIYLLGNAPERSRELAQQVLSRDPNDFSARLLLAKSYMGEKKFALANAEFERAQQLQPDNPAVYLALGIAQVALGKQSLAEANFKRARALDPARVETYQDLASLYFGQHRPADAEQILTEGTQALPESRDMHLALADLYVRLGEGPRAQKVLEALTLHTKDPAQLHSDLGDFWVAHNEVSRAVAEFQVSLAAQASDITAKKLVSAYITLGNAAEADRWNAPLLKKNPKDAQAKSFAGAIAYLNGNFQEATVVLRGIVAREPQSLFAHYYLGSAFLAQGDRQSAKTEFFECLKNDENFVHAYMRLAELSLQARDPDAAFQYAAKVISLSPWMAQGYLLAADAALGKGDTAQAEQVLRQADRIAAGNFLFAERWAELYARKKDFPRAEEQYQHALEAAPNPDEVLVLLTRYYLARKEPAKGVEYLQRYAQSHTPTAALYESLAQLFLERRSWAEAADASQKAIVLDSHRAPAFIYLGVSHERQSQFAEAERDYRRSIELDPGNLSACLILADLYARTGNFAGANTMFRQALKIDPNSPGAQAGLARVLADTNQDLNYALTLAQSAAGRVPEDPGVSDALAWVYHKKGMDGLALPLLQSCIAKSPNSPSCSFHLGLVYLQGGRAKEARHFLQIAIRNGLEGPDAALARQSLETQ